MPETPTKTFRLPADTHRKIRELAAKGYQVEAAVLRQAIDELHARIFGEPKAPRKSAKKSEQPT